MKLTSLLSGNGFVMYNKELAREVTANSAIVFGQLCSSYESFDSKDMLTRIGSKEYFFLTSETIQEETSITYRQQRKAIKELEETGYIETKVMGMPSRKYFHITDKLTKNLIETSRTDKMSDLGTDRPPTSSIPDEQNVISRSDKMSTQGLTKEQSMPEQNVLLKINNKKEQYKDNNKNNLVNKETVNKDEIIHKLTNEYRIKGLSKEVCLRVIDEVMQNIDEIENFGGYLRTCLDNTLYKSKVRKGEINPYERMRERLKNSDLPYFDWLNSDDEDELPY
ncbi:hypothetical protein [Radiobacillus deserti]|uniref:Uncharacterized protein n=1 Tax=Radiobacillus deserti TaxID=2594883 RepID=A0A516KDE8_9BACI|nr:hypothetical protein [Radiobacillus deserti]QDP39433.1 hypothetical protein FN924_04130 [Radiobacillus deserti]